jgi:hypothetical protein
MLGRRSYTMSKDAINQRIKYGFQRDTNFSGEWTMVRMRTEVRDALKKKFGTLTNAFDFALKAK